MSISRDRLSVEVSWEPSNQRASMADEVRRGLISNPRTLPCKYFYDDRGSDLFEEITRLPEYYQTRTEQRILESIAEELASLGRFEELVEIGSGSSTKTRLILDAMERQGSLARYVALDISEQMLRESARALLERYPGLVVQGVVADFSRHLVRVPAPVGARLAIFLGSTIGNLEGEERVRLLREVRDLLPPDGRFLLGLDLVKDVARLEAAYNDSAGVTAAFNKNILWAINRELGGDFDLEGFRHHAIYDAERARIEMHLVAERTQMVHLKEIPLAVSFAAGESIRTEISCKFTRESADQLLAEAGLRLEHWYTDPEDLFALALAAPA